MQLIIAGFHRSGTSLLTQLLHTAGLFVGDELLGAMPSNPYGHFEDVEVLELHRSILEAHGDDWQWDSAQLFHLSQSHWQAMTDYVRRRNRDHERWGFKEPRVCLLMGPWKHVLPEAKTVIVYRDPGECVRSMESRQASEYHKGAGTAARHLRFFTEPDHGLRLWDTYNRALVSYARAHLDDCLVIPFTRLSGGLPVVDLLNQRFGAGLDPVPTHDVFDAGVTGRRDVPQLVFSPEVGARVEETWHELEELATSTGGR